MDETETTLTVTTHEGPNAADDRLREELLGTRVATLIEHYPAALHILVHAGFGPLAVPALRKALAHTVTLRQALKIRSLPSERDAELLEDLVKLACRS